jgi:hypothetical protein
MRRILFVSLACASFAVAQQPAKALRIAIQNFSTSQKVAQADVVVTGKVTSVEKETVELPQFPGDKTKVAFTIAVIKIETILAGAKNVTHLKVAFQAQPGAVNGDEVPQVGKIGRRPFPGRGFGAIQLTEGQEAIFFLQKHPGSDSYYSVQQGFTPVAAKDENYKEELVKVKSILDAIADPVKALQEEKLDARLASAAAILSKYRQPVRSGQLVEVAIPAEETKLIMKTLLEADWAAADMPVAGFDYQASGPGIAGLVGLSPGVNGIPQFVVKPGESYNGLWKETVKTWYEKNGAKFEIKKFVAKEKK